MKRSRYSATMSRCFGSSNQSRERKRRFGRPLLASDAMSHDSLGKSGDVDTRAKQSTRERLLQPLFGVEAHAGAGDVEGTQVRAAERRLGHVGDRQFECAQQFALRRVAAQAPAAEQASPDAA